MNTSAFARMIPWMLLLVVWTGKARAANPKSLPKPVVAVFDPWTLNFHLGKRSEAKLKEHIEARVLATGNYHILPEGRLRAALNREMKKTSRKPCFTASCLIMNGAISRSNRIAKKLHADRSLATIIQKMGKICEARLLFSYYTKMKASRLAAGGWETCTTAGLISSLDGALIQVLHPEPRTPKTPGTGQPDALDQLLAQARQQQWVTRGMNAIRSKVRACFLNNSLPGLSYLRVAVDAKGKVSSVKLIGDFLGTAEGRCIVGVIRHAHFPHAGGKRARFSHPIPYGPRHRSP